jgi:endoglucanase
VYKTSDPAFAGRCLLAAEHIFDLVSTSLGRHLLTVIPFGFYPETEWRNDLELGATGLAGALAGGTFPRGCRTPIRCSTWARRPTGRTLV